MLGVSKEALLRSSVSRELYLSYIGSSNTRLYNIGGCFRIKAQSPLIIRYHSGRSQVLEHYKKVKELFFGP